MQALSCAAAAEDIGEGDEVIMPSYTYYATANACINRGASVVCVDIDPKTMTMDAKLAAAAVTERTKSIIAVHYSGVSSDMDILKDICDRRGLSLIEDAAQSLGGIYRGKMLGSIGDYGCFSFHATKNITSGGEGGAVVTSDPEKAALLAMVTQHGTDRLQFLDGQIDRYTWQRAGLSCAMSELSAACLCAQFEELPLLQRRRRELWQLYHDQLSSQVPEGRYQLPQIPEYAVHNSHTFYLLCGGREERAALATALLASGIETATHYIPLHRTPFGRRSVRFSGEDRFTSSCSERLLRLPMHASLTQEDVLYVCERIRRFYTHGA